MKPTRNKTPGRLAKASSKDSISRAPVRVYCRVRRVQQRGDVTPGLRVLSSTTVCLSPPADGGRSGTQKPVNYTFREVFTQDASQNEVFTTVALPLVENLIRGKNGLLFAYGVTGSGKTYTMTGEPHNPGIMPRCLDVIFKSIDGVQARRMVFKPDRMNMFEAQGDAEAALQRQQLLYKTQPKSAKKNNSNPDLAVSSSELSKVEGINEDCLYSVFVNYIEIYNNSVCDLLEEGSLRRSPVNKVVREDAAHNMYVHGVTEVEVKTRDEALEAFYRGMKRKRMAHTNLNSESSRSHSVFTIRLVQAPVDSMGESVVQDKTSITVRQLSLVDLAGSERTSRTNNTGQRLREAGNINNSLMTLRACLEALRENQQAGGANRVVPYRDAKVTHLFKNFFDGEGHVRMVVCVNPSCEDYDETLQVMRFAEVAMEVEVAKPRPMMDMGLGMTPGRRKANLIFKQARAKIMEDGRSDENLEVDLALVYSLGGDFPSLELNGPKTEELIRQLTAHLQLRLQRRRALLRDKGIRDEKFRSQLDELVRSTLLTSTETIALRAQLDQERQRTRALEQRLLASEETAAALQRRLAASESHENQLQQQLDVKDMMLNQKMIEKEHQKRKFNHKIVTEHVKMKGELEQKLKEQRDKLKKSMRDKEDKLRLVTHILTSEGKPGISTEEEIGNIIQKQSPPVETVTPSTTVTSPSSKRGFAVCNPRHRRSLSMDAPINNWVQHMSRPLVPSGTILQPKLPHRKSLGKMLDIKDITNTENYCLISQEQDTDGELETKLYKANVHPTCGGGAQVVFKDMEMLKQMDAFGTPNSKKREGGETPSRRVFGENKKPRI